MCGFVGYVGSTAPVTRERLALMRDRLTHRGPDDSGLYLHGDERIAMGLAHRRLSIIDTRDVGRQPMSNDSGNLWVAFNGEIYGFQALREDLESRGHQFSTRTDTEVILALYEAYGLDFVEHLDGMFAIALWDASLKRMVLVRDRLGIKPLFVSKLSNGTMLFGSEIKGLLASGVIDDGIDLQAHHDYLGLNYVPGPRTMISAIKRVEPAQMMVWENGETNSRKYWQQDLLEDEQSAQYPDFESASEMVGQQLETAVQSRMISDVPLGMFLSGGIDSSAVLMYMARASTQPVDAFTIRFDENSFDESEHARLAAKAFGARHHIETVKPDVATFLEPLTASMDEPYADSSAIPLWYLSRLARKHVTVALGGDGGDEVFAGYRTHYAWKLASIWRKLPQLITKQMVPALVDRLPVSHSKVSFDLKARAFVSAANRPAIEAHFGFKEFMSEDARRSLMRHPQDIENTVRLFERAVSQRGNQGGLHAVLKADFDIYLPDDILVKVDRMTMFHGLEARVPFLDHRLVEFSASLPAKYKLRGLTTKAILKRALRGSVPDTLLDRKKAGFNVPMATWLNGPLEGVMLDLLHPTKVEEVGLWHGAAVQKLMDEHKAKKRDHSRTLWALMCFMIFNDRFRGGRAAIC